ncbi:tigger transposable element-derived protein 6-like [Uloborus diversus]|uniref:tigger transposable element-derived protein 6-like n=1 Tax=Uloborus diversus TaxID=327109 RepID=UPI002409DC4D|nr:tigger transposable element-derived protein 6-like [Uloborus diversus]
MGIIKCFKGYYRKRLVESILLGIENKVEGPFKAVNVKDACDFIAGSWWAVTEKTILNCWKKAGLGVLEDKMLSDCDENSSDCDILYDQEIVLNLQTSVSQLEEKTGKKYGVNVEDYLTADDDLAVFAGVTDEEIISEITGEVEHSGEEDDEEEEDDDDDNTSPSQSLLSTQEALQSVKSLRTFFSSLLSTNEDHFRALDSMYTLLVDLTVKKAAKQTKILDFFQ